MKKQTYRKWLILASTIGVSLYFAGATRAWTGNTFGGRAVVAQTSILGLNAAVNDTGSLPATGGAQQASALALNGNGSVNGEVLHAAAVAQGDSSDSEASVAAVGVNVPGAVVAADFVLSRGSAFCSNGIAGASGVVEIDGLLVNGVPISVLGTPNQTVPLLGGRLVINEQAVSQNGASSSVTVNALHLSIGVADVVIASSASNITCGQ